MLLCSHMHTHACHARGAVSARTLHTRWELPPAARRGGGLATHETRVRARAQASPRHLSSSSSFSAYVRARRSLIAHEPPGAEGRQRAP